jgi:hypothetical protein
MLGVRKTIIQLEDLYSSVCIAYSKEITLSRVKSYTESLFVFTFDVILFDYITGALFRKH